jgi:hypothetical protein
MMKNLTNKMTVSMSKVDRQTVQIVLLIVSISLFLIGAGAPMGNGGIGG